MLPYIVLGLSYVGFKNPVDLQLVAWEHLCSYLVAI